MARTRTRSEGIRAKAAGGLAIAAMCALLGCAAPTGVEYRNLADLPARPPAQAVPAERATTVQALVDARKDTDEKADALQKEEFTAVPIPESQ